MIEFKYLEMIDILNHLPFVGVSVSEIAAAVNLGTTTIYNYRKKASIPTESKYKMIMSKLKEKYPCEVAAVIEMINKEKELLGENQNAFEY